MTYKGKEITEEELTTEIMREIINEKFMIPSRLMSYRYRYEFKGFEDKDKIFDYQKVLDMFLAHLHHPKCKKPDDIAKRVVEKTKDTDYSCYTEEFKNFREQREKAYREERRRKYELKKQQENKILAESNATKDNTDIKLSVDHNTPNSYNEQLEDIRWTAFRTFVFVVRGMKCEKCGSTHNINLHHPRYIAGRKAWEYTCNEVQVLCNECHKKAHGIK